MTCTIIVFAKAPVAGYAKTRLSKKSHPDQTQTLTPLQAAKLAERMLCHAIEQACAAGSGPVELCCSPNIEHPLFQDLAKRFAITLTSQGEGDLGARMERALARALAHHERALLTGTDAPALDAAYLRAAADALANSHGASAVFAPTHDGGYALIGVRAELACLFHDMPWSTPEVMAMSRQRLEQAHIRYSELPMLHDIDEAADLIHVPKAWLKELESIPCPT